jgi:hypothetical protein
MAENLIQWVSERGVYKAAPEAVEACMAYYAGWDADKLAGLVQQTSENPDERDASWMAHIVMLAEWGQYGSQQATWRDHKECKGFDPTSSSAGWHCYTHDLYNQEN